jgi:hypothetical protein
MKKEASRLLCQLRLRQWPAPCKRAPVDFTHSRHAGIEHAPRSITGLNQLHASISLLESIAFVLQMFPRLTITRIRIF